MQDIGSSGVRFDGKSRLGDFSHVFWDQSQFSHCYSCALTDSYTIVRVIAIQFRTSNC